MKLRLLNTIQKRWPEYVFESIVIIASILGAFALDSWNEDRKESIEERKIITQLIEEYELNLQQLDTKIEFREKIIENALKIYTFYDEPDLVSGNSILIAVSNIVHDPTFDPIDNDLMTTGNLRIIKNEELRSSLSNWSSNLAELTEMEDAWQKQLEEKLNPYLLETGLMREIVSLLFANEDILDLWLFDKSLKDAFSLSAPKGRLNANILLDDNKLEGFAAMAIAYNQLSNFQSVALRQKMQETLDLLKTELKK